MKASAFGADNAGPMSPFHIRENGKAHLFVNIGPHLNNRIALAFER